MTQEGRHDPGPSAWWEESWDVEFVAPGGTLDGEFGGFVRIAHLPNQRRMWCWVYVVRGDGTVVVRDHDIPMSSSAAGFLARAEGLWCELVCETPMEHWSIGVEAFGVRLDDPLDGLRGEIGTRLPVGLELEWEELSSPVRPETSNSDVPGRTGYLQYGVVRGDVLLGAEVVAIDGPGVKRHVWGERDWWTRPSVSHWCATDDGRPLGVDLAIAPVLDAVIPLPPRDGRAPFLTRSLVQAAAADGAVVGQGWLERLQIDG